MRRTARHHTLATLATATFAAAAALGLAACQTPASEPGAQASGSSTAATSSSAAPSPSPSPSDSSSAEPSATATTSAGPNRLTAPADGSTVTGPDVTITGEGTAFEGTLLWRVLTQSTGDVAQEGFTTAGANGTVGPFSVVVTLDPGVYTVEVWEPSEKDGATETRTNLVQATFTVVA